MYSDHWPERTWFPQAGLMMQAAGLVGACQLLAVAMVGSDPFESTGVRNVPQVALADCFQRSTSASRHGCIRQSQLESADRELLAASPADEESANTRNLAITNEGTTSERADKLRSAAAR